MNADEGESRKMTLNITAANPWFVVQVSDRRLTDRRLTHEGRTYDDEANKAVILGCRDALLVITYTGLGYINELRTDDWIVEILDANKVARRDMGFAVAVLQQAATETFSRLAEPDCQQPHTFVVAGWHRRGKRQIPYIWTVSNCEGVKSGNFGCVRDRFAREYARMARDTRPEAVALLIATGATAAADRTQLARVHAELFGAKDPERVVAAMVLEVRRAAAHPEHGHLVGRDCMTVVLPREDIGEVHCDYVPSRRRRVAYTPQIVMSGTVLRASEVIGDGSLTIHSGGRDIHIRVATESRPGVRAAMRSQRTPPRPG